MIRIAFVIDAIETSYAGTERHLLELLTSLDSKKFRVSLICLRQSAWLNKQTFSFPVEFLSFGSLLNLDLVSKIRKFITTVKRYNVDLIHSFYPDAVIITGLAANYIKPALLVTSRRGFINNEQPNRIKVLIFRILCRYYSMCICNSKSLAGYVQSTEGFYKGKIKVIHNGIDFDKLDSADVLKGASLLRKREIGEGDIVICVSANLRPVKNMEFLIRAARKVIDLYPNVHFVAIGDGEQRSYLESLIGRLEIKDRFHLLGSMRDPEVILANSDIGVLTSTSESLSNSLIEYSAMGLPIIASDVGGNREVLSHGMSGYLYTSNDLGDFLDKVRRLIENEKLRKSMGAEGRKVVRKKFSLLNCIYQYQKVYESIVSQ